MSASAPVTRFQLAEIGSLLADPARAAMLLALMDGSARPAGELAALAGVAASTASEHLRRLCEGGLLAVLAQGRHRYYHLAGEDAAHLLETLIAARGGARPAPRVARIPPALAFARTCYRHLAGRLGVGLFEGLRAQGALTLETDSVRLAAAGTQRLREAGLLDAGEDIAHLRGLACLDWTERRFHLAGPLGCELTRRLIERRWLRRGGRERTLALDAGGAAGWRLLGVDVHGGRPG
jgi:DNA-binding transcriptional ArsR family regulator